MTEVLLVSRPDGSIKSVKASGHSGFALWGKDIVCAAESIVLRTALEVLQKTEGILLKSDSSSRGKLAFSVEEKTPGETGVRSLTRERLICTGDFLREAFRSLEKEYPKNVHLREISED